MSKYPSYNVYNDLIDDIEKLQILRSENLEIIETDSNFINYDNLILEKIGSNMAVLPLDFILIQLDKLGYAINLVNDDNSHWAASVDGLQNISGTNEIIDISMMVFIESNKWKNTPKEAIVTFLRSLYDEIDEIDETNENDDI